MISRRDSWADSKGMTMAKVGLWLLLGAAPGGCCVCPQTEDGVLELIRIRRVIAPDEDSNGLEPSGLAFDGADLVGVSDDMPHTVFKVVESRGGVRLVEHRRIPAAIELTDIEGVAVCDGCTYVIDEPSRTLLRWSDHGDIRSWALEPMMSSGGEWLMAGGRNCGLEGVAAGRDGDGKLRLFVAKERAPRAIVELDPETGSVLRRLGDIEAAFPLVIQNSSVDIQPDYADLTMEDGRLYALLRNERAVVRFDLATGAVVQRFRLPAVDSAIYQTSAPYGLAEGLAIRGNCIWIAYDNNGDSWWGDAGEKLPILVEYVRPEGF